MSIISANKPFEAIIGAIKDSGETKIFISGCGQCATTCQSGGEEQVQAMKAKLEAEGITVTGTAVFDPACNVLKTKSEIKKMPGAEEAEAVLCMACGEGVQTLAQLLKKPIHPANDSLFIGQTKRVGHFHEGCSVCGECELEWTGGVCPMTICAKGILNGPCGGAKDGKCEVSSEKDCAWIKIYDNLKEQGKLENMDAIREPKDYTKALKPRSLVIGK